MNKRFLPVMIGMLTGFSAFAMEVSDGEGLAFELASDGCISSVNLHGSPLPAGNEGGFYLCEPNSGARRFPVVGKVVSKGDNKVYLNAELPLKARADAVFTLARQRLPRGAGRTGGCDGKQSRTVVGIQSAGQYNGLAMGGER